jgi:hypothetical protein
MLGVETLDGLLGLDDVQLRGRPDVDDLPDAPCNKHSFQRVEKYYSDVRRQFLVVLTA